ncbi:hypothetical protein HDU85_005479 [Gaertneriomyces sp. JEL0708]|nr:hypothetical protein HDU85_005479 [Gaertneriomyces sp. JEL0708]
MSFDQDFQAGIRLIRDSYTKKTAAKDEEIIKLRGDIARKDAEIKDLNARVGSLELHYSRAEKKLAEMSRTIAKLSNFKQSVMESLANDTDVHVATPAGFGLRDSPSPTARAYAPGSGDRMQSPENSGRRIDLEGLSMQSAFDEGSFSGNSTTRLFTAMPMHSPTVNERSEEPLTKSTSTPKHQGLQSPDRNNKPERRRTNSVKFTDNPLDQGLASTSGNVLAPPTEHPGLRTSPSSSIVDGRQFFKKARQTLSYDEFTTLLWNVKAYNNREQSRTHTLDNLSRLLDDRHRDLLAEFERLLHA